MEYKGIIGLANFENKGYEEWREKFQNKIEQARSGYTRILKMVENAKEEEFEEDSWHEDAGIEDETWENFKREIMSVLADKTTGEARNNIRMAKDEGGWSEGV